MYLDDFWPWTLVKKPFISSAYNNLSIFFKLEKPGYKFEKKQHNINVNHLECLHYFFLQPCAFPSEMGYFFNKDLSFLLP